MSSTELIESLHRERLEVRLVRHMLGENRRSRGFSERYHAEDGTLIHARITIATDWHRRAGLRGHDLTDTMIHEQVHVLRSDAKETWVREMSRHLYTYAEVRAAAAIRLLDAMLYEDLP